MNFNVLSYLLLLLIVSCKSPTSNVLHVFDTPKPIEGITLVAPAQPFDVNPMTDISAVGAEWVAVVPYGFSRLNESVVHYDSIGQWQWWGDGREGCMETIRLAHTDSLKVMLKPQIYIPGGWTGDMNFGTESDWQQWESGYRNYLLQMAGIAEQTEVELLCIGTEFKQSVQVRETFWRRLIKQIRKVYSGKLIYAANWDEYQLVPFWNQVDYIGVNAYFPLIDDDTPTVSKLRRAWLPIFESLKRLHSKHNRPIVFTEFGYLSADGCTYNTWELEKQMNRLHINQEAQANAYQALFETFWNADWWHGGFVWKWFAETPEEVHQHYRDYTPQGKLGEDVLYHWYGKR